MTHTARKDRENENPSFYNSKGSFGKVNQLLEPGFSSSAQTNRILAGYMAYEFLTRGTLFGQNFDPARAEAVPVSAANPKRESNPSGNDPDVGKRVKVEANRSYTEVAELIKGEGGVHIPGIVNPSQLSQWIQM